MPKFIDLTGQRFGRLVAIERVFNGKKDTYWLCKCDCGNEKEVLASSLRSGHTKSCGCYRRDVTTEKNKGDFIGKKFGLLTVLSAEKDENGKLVYRCQCDCGNQTLVKGCYLSSGDTRSCGCLAKKLLSERQKLDLTGKRFGKLIAIKPMEERQNGRIVWECKCDCGKITYVNTNALTSGNTSSCGCLASSKGELKIKEILNKNNIPYEEQKTFDTCRFTNTNALAKFDFYINGTLIEYDGKQHYGIGGFGEDLDLVKERDEYKNQWCKENNIPLIRIPYTHYKNLCLEDLLIETSKFVC